MKMKQDKLAQEMKGEGEGLPAQIFTQDVAEAEANGPQTELSATLSPKLVNIILLQGPGSVKTRPGQASKAKTSNSLSSNLESYDMILSKDEDP